MNPKQQVINTMQRVIVVGMGPIGAATARAIRRESTMRLVGLCDVDPSKTGKTAAELMGKDEKHQQDSPIPVCTPDLDEAIGDGADVAVVTTTSAFDRMAPLVETLLEKGMSVVSSCEEMAWPRYRHPDVSDRVDAAAKAAGKAVLGTGVNPGFVMDAFAVMFASMVRKVTKVRCVRRVDASLRREPLQKKVGATMTVDEFKGLAAEGKIGHKGLAESIVLLAAGLNRDVPAGAVTETLDPVVAGRPMDSALGRIEPGEVCGMHNQGHWEGEGLRVELDLIMAVGTEEPKDVIMIEGPVPIKLKVPGSLPGDSATVAALLNQIPNLSRVSPGLKTMLDMPIAGCCNRPAAC